MSSSPYREALASIHDDGFIKYAEAAAKVVLDALKNRNFPSGQLVDLGCGSGRLAQMVTLQGFEVLGVDLSPHMVALARERAPQAEFRVGSVLDATFPDCVAVTAIGECFNYLFDERIGDQELEKVFRRIFTALKPNGLFLFDVATPGRLGGAEQRTQYFECDNWAIVVQSHENGAMLKRRVITFQRTDGNLFQRDEETHLLRLASPTSIADQLRSMGFEVTQSDRYGELRLPSGMIVFQAGKPSTTKSRA